MRIAVLALALQVVERLLAVAQVCDAAHALLQVRQISEHDLRMRGVVLDQQDRNRRRGGFHDSSRLLPGSVKETVVPWPGPAESSQMCPPCTSMMRLTRASPMPVPSISGCNFSNKPNSLCW